MLNNPSMVNVEQFGRFCIYRKITFSDWSRSLSISNDHPLIFSLSRLLSPLQNLSQYCTECHSRVYLLGRSKSRQSSGFSFIRKHVQLLRNLISWLKNFPTTLLPVVLYWQQITVFVLWEFINTKTIENMLTSKVASYVKYEAQIIKLTPHLINWITKTLLLSLLSLSTDLTKE